MPSIIAEVCQGNDYRCLWGICKVEERSASAHPPQYNYRTIVFVISAAMQVLSTILEISNAIVQTL